MNFLKFLNEHIGLIIESITIIFVIVTSLKVIDFITKKVKENIIIKHHNSQRLLSFCPIISKIAKVLVLFIIIASVMQAHGYSMTSLIAGFGIMGMAVGFAAKETIANIFGSFAILYDKIFDINDYVSINDIEGTVVDINLRSTRIKTLDNAVITLPNNIVANAIITNFSAIKNRRIDEIVGITYSSSDEKIQRAIDIIKGILRNNDDVITDDKLIYLEKLNSSSIDIHFQAYVKYGDIFSFWKIRENVIKEIVKQYRNEGIDFAFPSQSIYLTNEN
ncbi:mechanosensitive ion channel family protein [bacterium]|nr:mechanosensitive ion channel family protein [bacterium]